VGGQERQPKIPYDTHFFLNSKINPGRINRNLQNIADLEIKSKPRLAGRMTRKLQKAFFSENSE